MVDTCKTPSASLSTVILTTPTGLASARYLVEHLHIVGVLVDHGPWGRPPRTVVRRFKKLLRHTFNRIKQPRQRVWNALGVPVVWTANINSDHARDTLRHWHADLGIILGGRIVQRETFAIPRLGTLNKHSSLLPRHRGLAAEYWCLYHEDFQSLGITVHFVDEGCDTGPILVQRPMTFKHGDTPTTLRNQSEIIGRDAIVEAVHLIERTKTTGNPQDESCATVNGKPTPETDRELNQRLPKLWRRYAA